MWLLALRMALFTTPCTNQLLCQWFGSIASYDWGWLLHICFAVPSYIKHYTPWFLFCNSHRHFILGNNPPWRFGRLFAHILVKRAFFQNTFLTLGLGTGIIATLLLNPKEHVVGHHGLSLLIGKWSAMQDLNLRPFAPKANALPDCANGRKKCSGAMINDLCF